MKNSQRKMYKQYIEKIVPNVKDIMKVKDKIYAVCDSGIIIWNSINGNLLFHSFYSTETPEYKKKIKEMEYAIGDTNLNDDWNPYPVIVKGGLNGKGKQQYIVLYRGRKMLKTIYYLKAYYKAEKIKKEMGLK